MYKIAADCFIVIIVLKCVNTRKFIMFIMQHILTIFVIIGNELDLICLLSAIEYK